MSEKSRQLVLEILLLREKYSERDIKSASNILLMDGRDSFLQEIMSTLDKISSAIKVTRQPVSPQKKREMLINNLNKKTPSSRKNLMRIARVLGINSANDKSDLLKDVIIRISDLTDDEVLSLSQPSRSSPQADEGYVGLANYLIKKD